MIQNICQEAGRFQYGENFGFTRSQESNETRRTGFHWENFSFIKAEESEMQWK